MPRVTRRIRIAALILALASAYAANAVADLLTTDVGPGATSASGPSNPCGTGVLDLSAGCPLAPLGVF